VSAPHELSPADWLALIIDRAPALREAGVLELTVYGVAMHLAPHEPPPAAPSPRDRVEEPTNALDDELTYGRRPGSGVPGFPRRRHEEIEP
jgi:hypothetical protein